MLGETSGLMRIVTGFSFILFSLLC
jgi:hypothetical protein